MLTSEDQTSGAQSPVESISSKREQEGKTAFLALLANYAVVGAAAFMLLACIEWVDLNFRLTRVFGSFSERWVLAGYLSLNVLIGIIIGLLVGLFAGLSSFVRRSLEGARKRFGSVSLIHRLVFALGTAGIAAFFLNQPPAINRYIIGLIREAEKTRSLTEFLLNNERPTSYLVVMGALIACSILGLIAKASASRGGVLRMGWLSLLVGLIAVAYYVDSRIEVQLYEYTLHRSMFLLNVALAMALAKTIYPSEPRLASFWRRGGRAARTGIAALTVLFVGMLAFTFIHFGKNQNLKTHLFYSSTQAKQCFKLAWWALDFDRDGYSAYLDGGDANDRRSDINPGQLEIINDGIDNNCIGGDLTQEEVDGWRAEHVQLRPSPAPAAKRFNIVFIFIDAVRADHLSAYGYHRNTTPNIDRLAARSTVFENAFSPAPRTSEAVQRFMQSSYWDGHLESWTEVLTRNGYKTMLFPGRRSWERYGQMMPPVKQAQGKALKENVDVVTEVLGKTAAEQPFCAFVYVPDPHLPYIKHDDFNYGLSVTDLYDGEVAYTDFHLGRLFNWMEQAGRLQDTMIVIMSDHGESLGERGVYRHSTQLYNEQTHVPMIMYVPGAAPRRAKNYVSTIDLGSTLLNAVGVECPKAYVGVSLMPLIRGESFIRPPVFAEHTIEEISKYVRLDQQVHPETKKYMVITQDGYKLIYNRDFSSFELFDLNSDLKEEQNLYNLMPEKAAQLQRLLSLFADIVTACRPWDADEGRYSRSGGVDGDQVVE